MANSPQARKRARQIKVRELGNASQRSAMRTLIKKVLKLLPTNKESAKATFQQAVKKIDILARRGIIHPNKAARLKSRLNSRIKSA